MSAKKSLSEIMKNYALQVDYRAVRELQPTEQAHLLSESGDDLMLKALKFCDQYPSTGLPDAFRSIKARIDRGESARVDLANLVTSPGLQSEISTTADHDVI